MSSRTFPSRVKNRLISMFSVVQRVLFPSLKMATDPPLPTELQQQRWLLPSTFLCPPFLLLLETMMQTTTRRTRVHGILKIETHLQSITIRCFFCSGESGGASLSNPPAMPSTGLSLAEIEGSRNKTLLILSPSGSIYFLRILFFFIFCCSSKTRAFEPGGF